jgi:hypothetical protein
LADIEIDGEVGAGEEGKQDSFLISPGPYVEIYIV